MDFHWEDERHIRACLADAVAPSTQRSLIPSSQKNGKHQEIPMLPELEALFVGSAQGQTHRLDRQSIGDYVDGEASAASGFNLHPMIWSPWLSSTAICRLQRLAGCPTQRCGSG